MNLIRTSVKDYIPGMTLTTPVASANKNSTVSPTMTTANSPTTDAVKTSGMSMGKKILIGSGITLVVGFAIFLLVRHHRKTNALAPNLT